MSGKSSISHPTQIRLLLLGYGRVAQAFVSFLASRNEWLKDTLCVHPVIGGIGTLEGLFLYPQGKDVHLLARSQFPSEALRDGGKQVGEIDTFIQMGKVAGASLLVELTYLNPSDGQPALTFIRRALESSLDVITANKGPVAYAQADLQDLATRHKVAFRFESAVMDGLPLVNLLQFTLPAVNILSFRALLNTTSSLVLAMIEKGYTREEAIAEAQQLGVAEADPWYDLDGWDALLKTTILANTLLGGNIHPAMVERQGIRDLSLHAIQSAVSEGTPLRLVSQAFREKGTLKALVHPQKIEKDDILRVGEGTTNVISLETEGMGTITWVEHSPTVLQTAYGIFSDFVTILKKW